MVTVTGTRRFGKIARIPGVLYVATQFVHFCFLPLFPTGSFVIRAGSEVSDGFFGGTFQGKAIPLHTGSVLAGYARWWCGVTMVIMTFAMWLEINEFLIAAKAPPWLGLAGFVGWLPLLMLPVALSLAVPGN